jgi:hypothetical protein
MGLLKARSRAFLRVQNGLSLDLLERVEIMDRQEAKP